MQMLANLYRRLATTTNALPTNKNVMRLVINVLRICFPIEFYDHVPNICKASKLSVHAYESLRILGDHVIIANRLQIALVSPFARYSLLCNSSIKRVRLSEYHANGLSYML